MIITSTQDKLTKEYIGHYLGILEDGIDPDHVRAVMKKQLDVFNFKPVDRLPVLVTLRNDVSHETSGHDEWPVFPFDQMWNDYGAMLLNELMPVYESIKVKDDKVFSVRPNLSQIVVPSLFGADGKYDRINEDSMPYIFSVPDKENLTRIMNEGVNFKDHWTIKKYCEIIDTWREILKPYPKLQEFVHFSLPDLQGPFNLYFLLRGQDAYTDLFDKPEFLDDQILFVAKMTLLANRWFDTKIDVDDIPLLIDN